MKMSYSYFSQEHISLESFEVIHGVKPANVAHSEHNQTLTLLHYFTIES